MPNKKQILLRLDPETHDALKRWADDELRSVNAQIEYVLRGVAPKLGAIVEAKEKGLVSPLRFGCSLSADATQNEMCQPGEVS